MALAQHPVYGGITCPLDHVTRVVNEARPQALSPSTQNQQLSVKLSVPVSCRVIRVVSE